MKIEMVSSWGELLASVAVVVTLVVLVFEVRATNTALERQAAIDRTAALTAPFFEDPLLGEILGKIKAVDGGDPVPVELMERYDLSYAEASVWERHLWAVWAGLEADFMLRGDEPEIRTRVGILKGTPDNRIYLETALDLDRYKTSFVEYVRSVEPFDGGD
jgi:hypothetical protein